MLKFTFNLKLCFDEWTTESFFFWNKFVAFIQPLNDFLIIYVETEIFSNVNGEKIWSPLGKMFRGKKYIFCCWFCYCWKFFGVINQYTLSNWFLKKTQTSRKKIHLKFLHVNCYGNLQMYEILTVFERDRVYRDDRSEKFKRETLRIISSIGPVNPRIV